MLLFSFITILFLIALVPSSYYLRLINCSTREKEDVNTEPNQAISNVLSLAYFTQTDNSDSFDLIANISDNYLNLTKNDQHSGNFTTDYVLAFAYCTNIDIYLIVTYDFYSGDGDGGLYLNTGHSYVDPITGFGNDRCGVGFRRASCSSSLGGYFDVWTSSSGVTKSKQSKAGIVSAKGEFIYHIKKYNRKITCEILDPSGNRILGRSWRSVKFLLSVNYLEITTYSNSSSCYNISLSNLESTIEYGNFDYEDIDAIKDRQDILSMILIPVGGTLFLILLFSIIIRTLKKQSKEVNSKNLIHSEKSNGFADQK